MAFLLGLVMPPLGPLAWVALSGSSRGDYLRSKKVRSGLAMLVGSALPFLVVAGAATAGLWRDPDSNPIGLGLLLFVGGLAGTIVVTVGIALVSFGRRSS
jgi:hypothetical protein